jgi:hypothetical protein
MAPACRAFLVAVILVTALFVSLTTYKSGSTLAVSASQNDDSQDLPSLDYETETLKEKSKERKQIDSHFKGRGNPDGRKQISELPEGVEPLPTLTHWWVGLSALPVEQSDVVVLGDIVDGAAHLSDDRTGIYSEFTVHVDEIFQDATGAVAAGGSLTVSRAGGGVRFASGRTQKYRIGRQGMPRDGRRYVLFLKRMPEGDLIILTGYEISGGRVTPLDGEGSKDPRSDLPFAQYRGADQAAFLTDVRKAAANSVKGSAK